MNNDNELKAFFESSFAEDYIKCTDYLVRRSVTGISAACELLRADVRNDGGLIDGIMTMCCELMRNAELSKALMPPAGQEAGGMRTIRLDTFLSEFAESCMKTAAGGCRAAVGEASAVYIRTDKELLRFLMLSFVRRKMVRSEGGMPSFTVSCRENGKKAEIIIAAKGKFSNGTPFGQPDVFDAYPDEVTAGLAARLGASAEADGDSLVVAVPLPDGDDAVIVEAPAVEYEEGFFNPFNIMLRDLGQSSAKNG